MAQIAAVTMEPPALPLIDSEPTDRNTAPMGHGLAFAYWE